MKRTYLDAATTVTMFFTVIILFPPLPILGDDDQHLAFANQTTLIIDDDNNNNNNNSNSNPANGSTSSINKVVILNFYDDEKDQFINAKPVLDKYGFKVTFFIVCSWANTNNSRMTWQDITQLYREGHDIESHSSTHKVLNKLSPAALDYEVGQSKQCLHEHLGINATIFSPPHSRGWNNATVINSIAKYYDLSIGGFVNDVMFLDCYGWNNNKSISTKKTVDHILIMVH